ncbi:hypothetical protein D9I37_17830 [Escherichia coli]|nr:hypothetical protein [Escherichia coli]PPQ50531.1 hypothetical protein C4623_21910 [Escherichia albertii]
MGTYVTNTGLMATYGSRFTLTIEISSFMKSLLASMAIRWCCHFLVQNQRSFGPPFCYIVSL